ncbi:MAG: glycogen synthase [Elusimicrobia bacterium]|nr:glycogen synthase [Elusimicrobiota bacterium]
MKILIATSECVPFIKVGGLADVCGALGKYLKQEKHDVRIILPLYKKIDREKFGIKEIPGKFSIPFGSGSFEVSLAQTKINNVPVIFVVSEKYFNRDEVYGTEKGDYPDQHERYIVFSRSVLEACRFINFKPEVIHCHDWQTGIIPAYLKTVYKKDTFFSGIKTVYTIHNIAYQGLFEKNAFTLAGFPEDDFTSDKLEYYGKFNFMKSSLVYTDIISTVSPTYSKEIRSGNEFGRGMEGILSKRKDSVFGIINGIDYDLWNPETDKNLKKNFSSKTIKNKSECKKAFLGELGISDKDSFLIGMISRIDPQKGFDMVADEIEKLLERKISLVILGKGSKEYQDKLLGISKKYPDRVSVKIEFNDVLAHRIYAGCDAFLMPSKFEPCGLGQLIAMRYGTVPMVARTGGLADSVDEKTGFIFGVNDREGMVSAVDSALAMFKDKKKWSAIVKRCMAKDFSWKNSIKKYIKLYKS